MKYILPWGLIFSRVLFAPLVIYLAMLPDRGWVRWWLRSSGSRLLGIFLTALLRVYFGIATPLMRRADSIADLIFWLGVGTAIWLWRPEIFRPHLWWIRIALLMECLTYVVSFLKFGKELAAHAYSGKLLGIGILLGFTHLWWTGAPQWTLYMMLILANVSQLDRFGIAFFLPRWTPDTPSTYHAWRIKKGLPIKKHKLFHGE